jgi:hypothetical protein
MFRRGMMRRGRVQAIIAPDGRVIMDVLADSIQRALVADNVFVEVALPKRPSGRVRLPIHASGYGRLESANHGRQRSGNWFPKFAFRRRGMMHHAPTGRR